MIKLNFVFNCFTPGAPNGKKRAKRPKNKNKAWIKLSEAILSNLGDCWGKFICSSLSARLMEEFQASEVYLQLIFSRRISRHSWLVGVWPQTKFRPSVGGGGGGGGCGVEKNGCGQPARIGLQKRYLGNRSIGCPCHSSSEVASRFHSEITPTVFNWFHVSCWSVKDCDCYLSKFDNENDYI